ncbi:MAG: DUF4956 domain-containing protein, partial [Vicinamibacteria bacterium]
MKKKRRALAAFLLAAAVGCNQPRASLVDRIDEAVTSSPEGRYASFVVAPSDRGLVRLGEDTRPSLTPPFPATLRFDLTLPESAFLSFAPALVARQEVRRAGVEFLVRVEAAGESTPVFEAFLDFEDVNRWHDREVDLSDWSGREVTLSLETRAPGGRTGKLWADRLQTVWGDPIVASNRPAVLAGALSEDTGRILRFALNLAIGGFLALAIRALYLRFGSTPNDRPQFGNLFPLFTLSTIVVVSVVQASIPLSLGLLGALSIVRFRSAIKTPEELVYLLFCVAVGIALAAEHRLLAAATVVLVALFVLLRQHFSGRTPERSFLLSISGDAGPFFEEASALQKLRRAVDRLEFQRLDRVGGHMELRTIVTVESGQVDSLPSRLREMFPGL